MPEDSPLPSVTSASSAFCPQPNPAIPPQITHPFCVTLSKWHLLSSLGSSNCKIFTGLTAQTCPKPLLEGNSALLEDTGLNPSLSQTYRVTLNPTLSL